MSWIRKAANAARNIQACLRLEADRLQVDSLFETANQHIGTNPDSHRGLSRGARVGALQGALVDLARREYGPGQNGPVGDPDINAELAD